MGTWTDISGLFFAANVPPGGFDAVMAGVATDGAPLEAYSWARGTIAADQVVLVHLSLADNK